MIIREFQEKDRDSVEEIFSLHWTDPEFLQELSNELHENSSSFFVAEEANKIVGIVGFKKLPEYLKPYASTNNPIEFYVIAVKEKGRGIGKILKQKLIDEARNKRFTEILLYSPKTHQESWSFHDSLGFERITEIIPPEDEIGQLWRKAL